MVLLWKLGLWPSWRLKGLLLHHLRGHHDQPLQHKMFPPAFSLHHCLPSLERGTHVQVAVGWGLIQVESGDEVWLSTSTGMNLGAPFIWISWVLKSEIVMLSLSGCCNCSMLIAASVPLRNCLNGWRRSLCRCESHLLGWELEVLLSGTCLGLIGSQS